LPAALLREEHIDHIEPAEEILDPGVIQ